MVLFTPACYLYGAEGGEPIRLDCFRLLMKFLHLVPLLFLPLGCSDVLGLDGLTYESPEANTVPASGGATGSDLSPGSGGESTATTGGIDVSGRDPDESKGVLDDFPSSWPEGTLFAFEAGTRDPYYFAYEPEAHRLSILKIRKGDDLITQTTWAEDLTWTQLVVVPSESGPILLGYDPLGLVERMSSFDEQGGFSVMTRQVANPNYSYLTCVSLDVGPMLFAYNQGSGDYRGVPALIEKPFPIVRGNIEAGRSHVTQLLAESGPALSFHNPETGVFDVFRIPEEALGASEPQVGSELEWVADGSLSQDEQFVGYQWMGYGELFVYSSYSGESRRATLVSSLGEGGSASMIDVDAAYDFVLRRDLAWLASIPFEQGLAMGSFGGTVLQLEFAANIKNEYVVR